MRNPNKITWVIDPIRNMFGPMKMANTCDDSVLICKNVRCVDPFSCGNLLVDCPKDRK